MIAMVFTMIACSTIEKNNSGTKSINNDLNRIALVIGNSNYENLPKLNNVRNDAEDVANILNQFGFHVDIYYDLNYEQTEIVVNNYLNKLSQNKNAEGFFYFAGNGNRFNDRNYILPIDINLSSDSSILSGSYSIDTFLNGLIAADNKLNIVIMDACFIEHSVTHRGLIFISPNDNEPILNDGLDVLENFTKDIFYLQSALPGQVAWDGIFGSRNSPFTKALLENIIKPINFNTIVFEIINKTIEYTNERQKPYYKANIFNYEDYIINNL